MALLHFTPGQVNALKMQQRRRRANDFHQRQDNQTPNNYRNISSSLLRSAWELARKFGSRTTIHGVNRLLGEKEGKFERIFWFVTVVCALFGTVYVCLLLSQRFNEGKFETVVDSTRRPVYLIPFPVVTICNLNRLNWKRIDEAKRRFLPNENSTAKLQLFEKIIGAYDDIGFANFDKFSVLEGDPLAEMNHVNFSLVFDFMTWRCEEFLTNCRWRHTDMDCCEIFSKRRSKSGLCWSFNTLETVEGKRMERLDPMWPWRTGNAGPTSGLNVRALINPEKHYPHRTNDKGLSVMITEPYVWHKEPFTVPENTESFMELEPVIYFYENNTRRIPSDQRECVFNDETTSSDFRSLHGYIYMIENCQSECHQEYLVRNCNCTLDLLFPPGQYNSCKATDLPCLAEKNERFLYSHQPGEEKFVRNLHEGMICKCFRNCHSLNYIVDVRPSFLPADVRKNISFVDLDVHFRFETMMVYRTSLVFGFIDLMVAFGGIAGLFLGCSLISGIELGYFLLIEMPSFTFGKLKGSGSRKTLSREDNMVSFKRRGLQGQSPINRFQVRADNNRKFEQFVADATNQGRFNEKPSQLPSWEDLMEPSQQTAFQKNYNSYY